MRGEEGVLHLETSKAGLEGVGQIPVYALLELPTVGHSRPIENATVFCKHVLDRGERRARVAQNLTGFLKVGMANEAPPLLGVRPGS